MTLLNSNISEINARFVSSEGQPQDAGFKLVRSWPWLSVDKLEALVTTADNSTTITGPLANTDTYSGTFVVSLVEGRDENVEGTNEREGVIIQTLTKVKDTPTTWTGLGTADIGADKSILNFLGFQEGLQYHLYYIFRNLNPADRATCMGLSTSVSGYTLVKREWKIESDKTATLYVVFEKNYWSRGTTDTKADVNWGADKVKVGYENYDARAGLVSAKRGGSGISEIQQLTGINDTEWDEEIAKALRGDTHRVVKSIRLVEKPNGEYEINQQQQISFDQTGDTDARIDVIQSELGEPVKKSIRRTWPRRTYTAKHTLADTSSGNARSNFKWQNDSYVHDNVSIKDNFDGTFDVIQELSVQDTGIAIYSRIKTRSVSNESSLGPPDVESDSAILNFHGFKEGHKRTVFKKYRCFSVADRATALAVSITPPTGFTEQGRKWIVERDNTASMIVAYERDTWAATSWTSENIDTIGYEGVDTYGNRGGSGHGRARQVTGIDSGSWQTVLKSSRTPPSGYVTGIVQVLEKNNGEYVVTQRTKRAFSGTTSDTALIVGMQSDENGMAEGMLVRTWPRRTYTAKETLVAGEAVGDTKIGTDSYYHLKWNVEDNRDGTFDVTQTLVKQNGGGGVYSSMYFNDTFQVVKIYTRSKDDKKKIRRYSRRIRACSSEQAAWNFIKSQVGSDYIIVQGTERVVKKGQFFYVADVLMTKNDTYHNKNWT